MARPEKCRRICNPPTMKGFKPFGLAGCERGFVILKFEEYESIRLIDYEMLSQVEASALMNVSRPTMTRIYNRALKQIAKSLIEGKVLEIEGGNYSLGEEWFRCKKCFKLIQGVDNHKKCNNCTLFGENELIRINKFTSSNL